MNHQFGVSFFFWGLQSDPEGLCFLLCILGYEKDDDCGGFVSQHSSSRSSSWTTSWAGARAGLTLEKPVWVAHAERSAWPTVAAQRLLE